jgi:ATP phosphoribosyltransferase regulatory subunit
MHADSHLRHILGFAHPLGVRDRAPAIAEPAAAIEVELLRLFRSHGYRLIRTPHIERLETLAHDLSGANQDQMFHLVDPERGEPLVLRPDLTPQVARHLAMHPPTEYPVRLAYSGTVFRVQHHNDLAIRERRQTGAELIGWSGKESDAEIMKLAVESLRCLGFLESTQESKVVFAIGSARVLQALLDALDLPTSESRSEVLEAIQRKAYDELVSKVQMHGGNTELASRINGLTGFPSDLKHWVEETWPSEVKKEIKDFADNIQAALSEIPEELIQLDLTEVRDRSYYTGIVFEAFATGTGEPLLAGGRYDRFLQQFGVHQPAAGFALNLDALAQTLSSDNTAPLIFVWGEYHESQALLGALRKHQLDAAYWPHSKAPEQGSWVQVSPPEMTWCFEKNDETVNGTGPRSDFFEAIDLWSSEL